MIKPHIEQLLQASLQQLKAQGELTNVPQNIQVDVTKDKQYGDFACNVAMVLAKGEGKKPRDIAAKIVSSLPKSEFVAKVEIAGPGFLNFYLMPTALTQVVKEILKDANHFGRNQLGKGKRVLIEFVSSNPTGPLHVGHGRHAVVGDVIGNLLAEIGYQPYREYYVNDAGRQMDIITVSIWLRYLNICKITFPFPANGYQGSYVTDIAQAVYDKHKTEFVVPVAELKENLPDDEPQGGDKEQYIDAIIAKAKKLLGNKYFVLFNLGLTSIIQDIREDLSEFGVNFDKWFSERELATQEVADDFIARLKKDANVYEQDGALWFASTKFGDEKDRVIVRANGARTYFANDAMYHLNKFERGCDLAIDIFGSDHHGYVPRMKAAMQASGIDPNRLTYILLQFVTLYRNGQQVQMSTRGGNFVTLRELREEVGKDAARYFYVMRKNEQHMDFDLDLAKSKTNENPVYYVQYAHARICSVLKQMHDRQFKLDIDNGIKNLALLTAEHEQDLLNTLIRYPELIMNAATNHEPHQLTNYLRELATSFHAYYNSQQFLVEDKNLRDARIALIKATQQILQNGFRILGITAPESM